MTKKRKLEADELESVDESSGDELKKESIEMKDEPMEVDPNPSSSFKVIGQETFIPSKKIELTSAWISNAVRFPGSISDNLSDLTSIPGIRKRLMKKVHENILSWFPVQKTVLSYLMPASVETSLLPPRDIAICAPTGSGKTLCYILPILNALENADETSVFAIVVAPVQNLAQQIYEEFTKYNVSKARINLLCGNRDYEVERKDLFPNESTYSQASIVIATPGRLVEHLVDLDGEMDLSTLRYLVIDEADRMSQTARLEWLDLLEDCANVRRASNSIYDLTDNSHNRWLQKILVSATLSLDVEKLFMWNLRFPKLFRATAQNIQEIRATQEDGAMIDNQDRIILPDQLKHEVVTCELSVKPLVLQSWIKNHPEWKKILVFANDKISSYRLSLLLQFLASDQFVVSELSSNLFGKRRSKVLNRFKTNQIRVLIASDLVARGIDVSDIDCVVNYDYHKEDIRHFIHRAGRTARAGRTGFLLSLVTKPERLILKKLLVNANLWDKVEEIRNFDESITEEDQTNYKTALEKLKNKLENVPNESIQKHNRQMKNVKPFRFNRRN